MFAILVLLYCCRVSAAQSRCKCTYTMPYRRDIYMPTKWAIIAVFCLHCVFMMFNADAVIFVTVITSLISVIIVNNTGISEDQ